MVELAYKKEKRCSNATDRNFIKGILQLKILRHAKQFLHHLKDFGKFYVFLLDNSNLLKVLVRRDKDARLEAIYDTSWLQRSPEFSPLAAWRFWTSASYGLELSVSCSAQDKVGSRNAILTVQITVQINQSIA